MLSYRRLSLIFLAVPLVVLGTFAALTLVTNASSGTPVELSRLINTDLVRAVQARLFYPFGISFEHRVIIGPDGWLFHVNGNDQAIRYKRDRVSKSERRRAERIGAQFTHWAEWFEARGAKQAFVMIAPDKDDIYTDILPRYAHAAPDNLAAVIRRSVDPRVLIDTIPILNAARERDDSWNVFLKTDTHWTMRAAWVAFDALLDRMEPAFPDLVRPEAESIVFDPPVPLAATDLASILRMRGALPDHDLPVTLPNERANSVAFIDYATGQVLQVDGSVPLDRNIEPIIARSSGALNQMRVLWLRDSFGGGMQQEMWALFSDVLQFNFSRASGEQLAEIMERFQPDLVVITVVNRLTRHKAFRQTLPEPAARTAVTVDASVGR